MTSLRIFFLLLGWTLLSTMPSLQAQDLNDGLVAYYPFNGNAEDESGNGNHLTEQGSPEYIEGVRGNAIRFDGIDDAVLTNRLISSNGFTWTGWFRVLADQRSALMAQANPNIRISPTLYYNPDDKVVFSNYPNEISHPVPSLRTEWTSISIVMANNGSRRIYVNGELNAENTSPTGFGELNASFVMGRGWTEAGNLSHYQADEVRIYDRALSEQEIAALYDLEKPAPPSLTNGLVAYYPFNGNANDESGNGNHLTTQGSPEYIEGVRGNAIRFDGIDDLVLTERLISGNGFTWTGWFKVLSETGAGLMSQANASIRISPSLIHDMDRIYFYTYTNTGHAVEYLDDVSSRAWRSISIVVSENGSKKLYINGELKAENSSAAGFGELNDFFVMGADYRTPRNYQNFQADEVRIYSRGLSGQEISALYHLETPKPGLNDGLVAYYPFNGNANDESGNGNDGTVNGATLTVDRNGEAGSAYDFDGDDFIESPVTLSPYNLATFSTWVRTSTSDAPVDSRGVVSQARGRRGTGFVLHINDGGRPRADYLENAGNRAFAASAQRDGVDISDNSWYHLVATNDGERIQLFIDGMLTASSPAYVSGDPATTENILIGKELPDSIGRFFIGNIDDVRIYDRALSEEEVRELYELEKPRPTPPGLEIAAYLESAPGETLTVDATPISGFPIDFTYQWYLDGVAIPAAFGGTGSSVTFDGVLTDEGSWRVVVTNTVGSTEATFDYRVFVDTDGDGLSDGYEARFSLTDPFDADTDRDWLNDGSEVLELGTDPLLGDTDGDGFDDYYELRRNFDPTNADQTPESVAAVRPTGEFQFIEFSFNAAEGIRYRIESSTDLSEWATEETGISGEGGTLYRYYSTTDRPSAYFRVRRE